MSNLLFVLCFSFFAAHELDAMTQAEWRLLYGFRDLQVSVAEPLFVLGHVPLFALLLWLTGHSSLKIRRGSRALFAGFAILHAGLHFNLRHHPFYRFDSSVSQALIYGAAVLGSAYLLLCLRAALNRHQGQRP